MLYEDYRLLARTYLALLRERVAAEARVRKLVERKAELRLIRIMEVHRDRHKAGEKSFLQDCVSVMKEHAVFKWAGITKGLGNAGAFMLFHINPYKAQTVGQAKAFFGIAPELGLKAGKRARFDPVAKGRSWLITRNILMAGDCYYRPLYAAKKFYYLETRGMKEYIQNPSLCPQYEACKERLTRKAQRLGRKAKKAPCRGHVDSLAKRWLMGIVIGNALELMRDYEDLPVENIRSHSLYIRPKPHEDAVPPTEIIEGLKAGKRASIWQKPV
jgi:hypothetical protein